MNAAPRNKEPISEDQLTRSITLPGLTREFPPRIVGIFERKFVYRVNDPTRPLRLSFSIFRDDCFRELSNRAHT